jgi:hypothetical protein
MGKTRKLPGQEPLLSTVARKLGRAAGTLAKVTHDVTGSLSSVTSAVAAGVSEAAPKQKSKSQTRGRSQIHRAVSASGTRKRKPASRRARERNPSRGTS